MQISCKKCGNIEKVLTKSQAYDLARFEGCGKCGGNTLAVSSEPDPDWLNDVERDLRDIAELETEDCGPQPWQISFQAVIGMANLTQYNVPSRHPYKLFLTMPAYV